MGLPKALLVLHPAALRCLSTKGNCQTMKITPSCQTHQKKSVTQRAALLNGLGARLGPLPAAAGAVPVACLFGWLAAGRLPGVLGIVHHVRGTAILARTLRPISRIRPCRILCHQSGAPWGQSATLCAGCGSAAHLHLAGPVGMASKCSDMPAYPTPPPTTMAVTETVAAPRSIVLFDVDGTLTPSRKVRCHGACLILEH